MNSCGKGMDSFLGFERKSYLKKYLSILEADANVVLTRQNCRVNTVGNSFVTIYNKHVLERARHESEGAGALQYEIVKEIIYYE